MIAGATKSWVSGLCYCLLTFSAFAQSSGNGAAERYAEAGQKALGEGRLQDAENAYEKLRELEPGIAEVFANLGLIYFQQGRFDDAVPTLRQALKLKPGLAKTENLLAVSLSELGRYKDALPGLEKGFHRGTDREIKRMSGLQLLRAYSGLRLDRKAVEVALELDNLYPNDPEILFHTGRIYGNFAFLNMQKLAQVAPSSIWRHQALAEAYESQGSYDAAIGEYRQVLAQDPNRVGIHYRLGRTLLARSHNTTSEGDAAEALKEFQQELALDPSNANAAYEIADANRNAGQLEEAKKFFEVALKSHPDFEEAHLGLGSVLTSLQQPEQALPHIQKALSLDNQNEVAWYRLSQVQGMLGNNAERQKAFAEFQRLRDAKSKREEAGKEIISPDEVTKQQVGSEAPKQ